jgi:hypothetical protein
MPKFIQTKPPAKVFKSSATRSLVRQVLTQLVNVKTEDEPMTYALTDILEALETPYMKASLDMESRRDYK